MSTYCDNCGDAKDPDHIAHDCEPQSYLLSDHLRNFADFMESALGTVELKTPPVRGMQVVDKEGHVYVEHPDCGWIRWRPTTRSWVTGHSWEGIAERGPVRINLTPVPMPTKANADDLIDEHASASLALLKDRVKKLADEYELTSPGDADDIRALLDDLS